MKKVLGTIEVISGGVLLFSVALTIGALVYEVGYIFATAAGIAMLVFLLVSLAEWFYDKGKEEDE